MNNNNNEFLHTFNEYSGISPENILPGTFREGDYKFPDNVEITGNLTVNGTTITINTENLIVEDPLVKIGNNNPSDTNTGIYWCSSNNTFFGGLVKEGGSDNLYLLSNTTEPTTVSSLTGLSRGTLYASNINLNGIASASNTHFLKYNSSTGVITYQNHTLADVFSSISSTTNDKLCRFDSTTGKLIQDCSVICDDSGNLTGISSIIASSTVYGSNINQDVSTNGQPQFLTVRSGSGTSTILLYAYNTSILLDGHYGNSPSQQLSYYCDQKDGFYVRPIRNASSGSSNILTYDTSRYEMIYTTIENIAGLSTNELNQLRNIDNNTISNSQWGYLSNLDQNLSTTSEPRFERIWMNRLKIGNYCKNNTTTAVSIGSYAGYGNDALGTGSVVIGYYAGYGAPGITVGNYSVSIGTSASSEGCGLHCINIGYEAGYQVGVAQVDRAICLNASGVGFRPSIADSFNVKPVRSAIATNTLFYNATSGEISYQPYAFNQNLNTSSAVNFSTINGRDVSVDGFTLDNLNTTIGLGGLTTAEVNQLKNIDSHSISNTQWGYLSALDQKVGSGDTVQFNYGTFLRTLYVNAIEHPAAGLTVNGFIYLNYGDLKLTTGNIVLSQAGATVDGIDLTSWKSDYDSKINQAVLTSSSPSFTNLTLTGNLTLSTAFATVDGVDLSSFKTDYDSKINQAVLTTSSPSFTKVNMTNVSIGDYSWNDSAQSVSVGHYSNHFHTSNIGYVSLGYAVGFQGALGTYSVNIGNSVAYNGSGTQSVSVGFNCNPLLSGNYSTSVGAYIGSYQAVGSYSTNLGYGAGLGYTSGSYNSGAGENSVNIGRDSSYWGSGSSSVNIGYAAGSKYNTPIRDNAICINATGNELSCPANSSCVIKPVRNTSNSNNIIQYDSTSGELTHYYAVNQSLLTSSDVQFDDCKLTGHLTLPSSGGTASNLNHYEEYNLTSESFTIFANTPTTDINITRVGRVITLCIAGISLTSSGAGNSYFEIKTAIPSRFRPIRDMVYPLSCGNNSTTKTGILTVFNSGNITIHYDITLVSNYGSGFNNNFVSISVSYNV